jgi:PAS domain S-box-containing protein
MALNETLWRSGGHMTSLDGVSLDQMLARSGDGVLVVSADGRVILWNRAAERILGYTAREVVGRGCCDVMVGRDDHGNRLCYQGCHVQTLARMGEAIQSFDLRSETKAGQAVWLNVSILPVTNGRGNGSLIVHLFRDVTATKELLTLIHERLAGAPAGETSAMVDGPLTRRELEVLRLLATGVNTKGAADKLHVSPATVRNHVQNIFGKLAVHSRLEAVAYANRHRLL